MRFAAAIYVLHAFKKKAKRDIKTPKKDLNLIAAGLKKVQEDYAPWLKERKP